MLFRFPLAALLCIHLSIASPPRRVVDNAVQSAELRTETENRRAECEDAMDRCGSIRALCDDEEVKQLMLEQCPRTCNRCDEIPDDLPPPPGTPPGKPKPPRNPRGPRKPPPGEPTGCRDDFDQCEVWIKYGFCKTPKLTNTKKKELCRLSCGLCSKAEDRKTEPKPETRADDLPGGTTTANDADPAPKIPEATNN